MQHERKLCQPGDHDGLSQDACNLCELFMCAVCGGAEGSLPTDCPGVRMTQEQEAAVYDQHIDYREGRWVKLGYLTPLRNDTWDFLFVDLGGEA